MIKNIKKTLKEIAEAALHLLIIASLAGIATFLLLGLPYLDYRAYKERYPNAAAWTYFFQPKGK